MKEVLPRGQKRIVEASARSSYQGCWILDHRGRLQCCSQVQKASVSMGLSLQSC